MHDGPRSSGALAAKLAARQPPGTARHPRAAQHAAIPRLWVARRGGGQEDEGYGATERLLRWELAMANFFEKVFHDQPGSPARKPARKPWWLVTTSVRHGLVMGGGYLGSAAVLLLVSFFTAPVVTRIFAVLWLVLGAWFLASAAAVRRREAGRQQDGSATQ